MWICSIKKKFKSSSSQTAILKVAFLFANLEKFLHALNLIPGMNYSILRKLWNYFQDWKQVWKTTNPDLLNEAGLTKNSIRSFVDAKKNIQIENELEQLFKLKIALIAQDNPEYPFLLKEIPNPPFLLYRKGSPLHLLHRCVAIVGTRMPSTYGQKMASNLSKAISFQGGITISGLAFGIDAQVHRAAIKEKKPTIAILPTSLTNIMPPSHFQLAQEIIRNGGVLLSEYANDKLFYKSRFLERNRLISGLSMSTIIIEAKLRSGALITARHALEQNRTLYALPGDITRPQAQGCLQLIAQGAEPVISIDQLLDQLGFEKTPRQLELFNPEEQRILKHLEEEARTNEELAQLTGLPLPQLFTTLTTLELKSAIHKTADFKWVRD